MGAARWVAGVESRSERCLRSWKSWALKRWSTLRGTVSWVREFEVSWGGSGAGLAHHGVVGEVGGGLIRGGGCCGALPSGDVDGVEVFRHLRDLDGIKTPECEADVFVLEGRC